MSKNYTTDDIKNKFGIDTKDIAITCYPNYGGLVQYTIKCREKESSITIDKPTGYSFERFTSNDKRFQEEINYIMGFNKSQVIIGIRHP